MTDQELAREVWAQLPTNSKLRELLEEMLDESIGEVSAALSRLTDLRKLLRARSNGNGGSHRPVVIPEMPQPQLESIPPSVPVQVNPETGLLEAAPVEHKLEDATKPKRKVASNGGKKRRKVKPDPKRVMLRDGVQEMLNAAGIREDVLASQIKWTNKHGEERVGINRGTLNSYIKKRGKDKSPRIACTREVAQQIADALGKKLSEIVGKRTSRK